jgi:hypothetical protein
MKKNIILEICFAICVLCLTSLGCALTIKSIIEIFK